MALINESILTSPITLSLVVAWEIAWRGLGLWKSAQRAEKYWFIAILIVNSFGILPILYLFVFSNEKKMKVINSYLQKVKKFLNPRFDKNK